MNIEQYMNDEQKKEWDMYNQIPTRDGNYTSLHDNTDMSLFSYSEIQRYHETRYSRALGNHWQDVELQSRSKTKNRIFVEKMQTMHPSCIINNYGHYTIIDQYMELLPLRPKQSVSGRHYMYIESIESCYISDLDSGEEPFNNPYNRMYPHPKNPNKVDYVGSTLFPDIGADKVQYWEVDNVHRTMGMPRYRYEDRMISIDIKGYDNIGPRNIRISVPKGNDLDTGLPLYRDIELLKIKTVGSTFYLLPICKYGDYWIYNSFNKNHQHAKNLTGKTRTNLYRRYKIKEQGFNESGKWIVPQRFTKQKETIIETELVTLRITHNQLHKIEPDTIQRKQQKLHNLINEMEKYMRSTAPELFETRINILDFITTDLKQEIAEITA